MDQGVIFVTVGTTEFDRLIVEILQSDVLKALRKKGYRRLVLQIGKGSVCPEEGLKDDIQIEYYRFKDSLAANIAEANLVISHAGAGSCLEILQANKPAIVVINDELMDNHQSELAYALAEREHVVAATPTTLLNAINELNVARLKPFPPADPNLFTNFLNNIMGIVK